MDKKTHMLIHEDCIGCGICQMACSLSHYNKISPLLSRITIVREREKEKNVIGVCHQCESPLCIKVCPMNALSKDPVTNATIRNDNCVGCKNCVYACPVGAIFMDENASIAVCDMCEGDPLCVKLCPREAIRHLTDAEIKLAEARIAASKLLSDTQQDMDPEDSMMC
jgi:anaerobic carbon-monoxide dehydrogenase iron sulfur subunit